MLYRLVLFILAALIVGCSSEPSTPAQKNEPNQMHAVNSDSLSSELKETFSRSDSSAGQTIYVPVYSHIYQQNHNKTFNLTATLSIRNTDLNRRLLITKVLYYDSQGKLVKNYIDRSATIKPLASTSFVVEENDLRGGVGANFIVVWESDQPVFPPVVEAVMISTSQQQGISFVSVGRVLEEESADSLNSK